MKAPRHFRLLAALAAFAGASLAAVAQLTTFSTIPDYTGSDISGGAGKAYTQTFTHVLAVQSMTFRFVRTAGASATNVPWYFAEWDTTTNRATTLLDSNTLSVPGVSSFTTYQYTDPIDGPIDYLGYDYQLTLNSSGLNATKTYALILLNSSSNVKLQLIDGADNFVWGAAYNTSGITNTDKFSGTSNSLTTVSASAYAPVGTDWGFSQIVVDLAPVPEPATAAAGIGAVLIVGLVILRQYRRRQEQSALALVPIKA